MLQFSNFVWRGQRLTRLPVSLPCFIIELTQHKEVNNIWHIMISRQKMKTKLGLQDRNSYFLLRGGGREEHLLERKWFVLKLSCNMIHKSKLKTTECRRTNFIAHSNNFNQFLFLATDTYMINSSKKIVSYISHTSATNCEKWQHWAHHKILHEQIKESFQPWREIAR